MGKYMGTTRRARATSSFRMDGQNSEAVMHQVQSELANAYAQEFFTTVREKCFAKCIPKPGTSLSSGEQTCIARCTDRYVDATRAISNVVLQAYSQGGAGGMQ